MYVICILNGKHWNHEPSKIHTFIIFHLPRHWHCIGTATCEIGPRRTKGLGIWVSKSDITCYPSQSSCLGGSESPPSPEKIDVGEKIKVQTSRGWETLRTACSYIFLRPELQCFWPLLNRCAKKWNVGLGKSKYINQCIFLHWSYFFFQKEVQVSFCMTVVMCTWKKHGLPPLWRNGVWDCFGVVAFSGC